MYKYRYQLYLSTLVFAFIILLIFLGMRVTNPEVKHSPREHPRAVSSCVTDDIRNIIDSSLDIAHACKSVLYTVPTLLLSLSAFRIKDEFPLSADPVSEYASRAPPYLCLNQTYYRAISIF